MDDTEKAKRNLTPLPRNLMEATEHLGQSELAKNVMGEAMMRSFLAYKIDEWNVITRKPPTGKYGNTCASTSR